MKRLLLSGILTLPFVSAFGATTITVDSDTCGASTCCLDHALKRATGVAIASSGCAPAGSGAHIINFASSFTGPATLPSLSSHYTINSDVTIDGGSGAPIKITTGGGSAHIFTVNSGKTLTLKNLIITHNSSGSLSLLNNSGTVVMERVTLYQCKATAANGKIIQSSGTLNIINSTFHDNTFGDSLFSISGGSVTLKHVTVSENSSGKIFNLTGGSVNASYSIFANAGNVCSAGTYAGSDVFVTSNTNCTSYTQKTLAQIAFGSYDATLGVIPLQPTSEAINQLTTCDASITKDQRGAPRNLTGQKCDLGAYEIIWDVTVNISPSGAGSVSPSSPIKVDHKGSVTLTASANSGFTFQSWSGDCTGTNASFTLNNIEGNKTCTANFTSSSSGGSGGSGGGSGGSGGSGGGSGGSGGSGETNINLVTSAGTINVQLSVPSSNISHSPTPSNVQIPPGFRSPFGAVSFQAQLPPGVSFITVRHTYPKPIPQGSRVLKLVGNTTLDITPQVQIQGSVITFRIDDNTALDADTRPGFISDPVIVVEPMTAESGSSGGGGGCSTSTAPSGALSLLLASALFALRRFRF